jgi:hypothetical protein
MATGRVRPLLKRIDILLRDPSIETAVKHWALEALDERAADRQRVLRSGGYGGFVLEYIQREAEAFTDDERECTEALCSCRNTECPLLQRTLPAPLLEADSIDAGIREFRQTHRGNPRVLGEAQQAWGDLVTGVEQDLRSIMLHLSDETIPTGAEAGDDAAPSPSPAVGQSVAGTDSEKTESEPS